MHTQTTAQNITTENKRSAAYPFLREAKRLHRAATSNSSARALPVLRRLLKTQTLKQMTLPQLWRARDSVKRKHVLHMFAKEAGYSNWALLKHQIERQPQRVSHYSMALRCTSGPNIWFSSMREAEAYSQSHGGKPVEVGDQAVIVIT